MATPTYRGDVFPADVTLPDGTRHETCRVRARGDGVTVYVWSHDELSGVPLVEAARLLDLGGDRYAIDLGQDGMVEISKAARCGCGHPMKSWRPPGASKL